MTKIPKEWIERMQPNSEQQKTAELRYEISLNCSLYSNFKRPECKDCGCYIEHKIYSSNELSCPLNKWKN
jgi:hypothetical protein